MYIPNEQLEREDSPLAFQLTIWLSAKKTAEKYPLESRPNQEQKKLIEQLITELINFFAYRLRAARVGRKKIEIIVDAPVNTEKIINGVTLGIIEILRHSPNFSDKINLWHPRVDVEKIWTVQELKKAVEKVERDSLSETKD